MFGNFITSPEVHERSPKKSNYTGKATTNSTDIVKTQIRELISKMPSH